MKQVRDEESSTHQVVLQKIQPLHNQKIFAGQRI